MKLTHSCLVTKDIRSLADFYRRVLQIEPQFYGDDYVEFPFGGVTLSIFSLKAQEEMAPASVLEISNKSVMFEFEVNNVEEQFTRVRELGVEIVKPVTVQSWGNKSFYFRDPDGNLLNFFEKIVSKN